METERKQIKTSEPIEILLVADAKYASYLATTIVSILANAASDDSFRFHVVDAGLTADDRAKIAELKRVRDFEIAYYQPDLSQFKRELARASGSSAYPPIVTYRLFAARYLPESLDKFLYLDVDLAILDSLRELWETPLTDELCAAVPDKHISVAHIADIGLTPEDGYFNTGVFVANLKKWRDEDLASRFLAIFAEKSGKLSFPDQDAMNLVARETSFVRLDPRWNCHPRDCVDGETRILHYQGRRHRCPRLDVLFGYAAMTPYKRLPFQGFRNRVGRVARRALCDLLSVFVIFSAKRRRALRKLLNVR